MTPSRRSAPSVRRRVRDLLTSSPSYRGLPPDRRRELAHDTVRVAAYLVDPHGLLAAEFRSPLLAGVVSTQGAKGKTRGVAKVAPDAIAMNPRSIDALVAAVDFPGFVAGLIEGVFGAIVNASIEQMEAYAALIAAVAKSVDEFAKATISDESARDALVDAFPDAACWAGTGTRRLKLHAPAGSPSLTRLAAAIGLREPVAAPQKPGEVRRVVAATRRRLARNRQQLLATTILMGINRIVVTDGSISPKQSAAVADGGVIS